MRQAWKAILGVAVLAAVGIGVWLWVGREKTAVPTTDETKEPAAVAGGRFTGTAESFAGVGWSLRADTRTAAQEALAEALDHQDLQPDMTLVYYTAQHPAEAVVEALQPAQGPKRRICGWVSDFGVIASDGYHHGPDGTVGVMALRVPGMVSGVGWASLDEVKAPADLAALALRRAAEDAGVDPARRPSMIVLSCTYHGQEEKVLEGLEAIHGPDVPVLGGTTAGAPGVGTLVANGQVIKAGTVIAVFYSDQPFRTAFRGGFNRTGMSGTVTRSDGRVIYEIDGRPAVEVYDEWSGGRVREAMRAGLDMNSFTVLYPLCRILDAGDQTYNLFTHLWPPDNAETTTRLVSSATLSDGDVVYFSEGSWNILLNRISALPRLATEGASEVRAAACLFICCEGVLKVIPEGERGQMVHLMNRSLEGVPWIGPFTWGEEGNFPGLGNRHGNLLTGITLFPAGEEHEE